AYSFQAVMKQKTAVAAMPVADRIVIMHEGILQQIGTPEEVYAQPANTFVAQFVGSPVMNMAPETISETGGHASVQVGDEVTGFELPAALAN
ncbi:hypothetical protein ACC676_38590, partial [Rhizobium ruizarguesonis]